MHRHSIAAVLLLVAVLSCGDPFLVEVTVEPIPVGDQEMADIYRHVATSLCLRASTRGATCRLPMFVLDDINEERFLEGAEPIPLPVPIRDALIETFDDLHFIDADSFPAEESVLWFGPITYLRGDVISVTAGFLSGTVFCGNGTTYYFAFDGIEWHSVSASQVGERAFDISFCT